MDSRKTLIVLFGGLVVAASIYSLLKRKKVNHYMREMAEVNIPTSPEVLFIEGTPDTRIVRLPDGGELVRPHDIALNPRFGVGEGTFGFGRFGSSFMA